LLRLPIWGRIQNPEAIKNIFHVWMEVMLDVKEDKMERVAMVCKFIEEMKVHEPIISDEEEGKSSRELILQWDYATLMDKPGAKNPPSSFQQLNKDLAD
jgi:hypothetical protein